MPYEIQSIEAPDSVAPGETFSVRAEVCCVDPPDNDCPQVDYVITAAGSEVHRQVLSLLEGCVTVPLHGVDVTIDEPGVHDIVVAAGGVSKTKQVTVKSPAELPEVDPVMALGVAGAAGVFLYQEELGVDDWIPLDSPI